jgi:hypothetical protein
MSVKTKYPNLQCRITRRIDEIDKNYNSVAWAMDDRNRCWEPDPSFHYYWPDDLPRKHTLRVFEQLFESHEYESAHRNDQFEHGYEKIAIYVLDGQPTHVARQRNSGEWTSKMGRCEEIEHIDLHQLESENFGYVATILKRRIRQ